MDWLVSLFQRWLGIDSLQAQIRSQGDRLDHQTDLISKVIDQRAKLIDQSDDLKRQVEDLRRIITTRQPVAQPVKARSWTEARRLMGDEVLQDAER